MIKGKRIIIWTLCSLIAVESVLFIDIGIALAESGCGDSVSIYTFEIRGKDGGSKPDQTNEEEKDALTDFQSAAKIEAGQKGLLILVNKEHSIDKDYVPDDLTAIDYYVSDRSKNCRYMREEAAKQFHELVEDAALAGHTIRMTTAYRSYGFQQILWNNYVSKEGEEAASKYSARPGESEHQTGLAVDVTSPSVNNELTMRFGDSDEGIWLADNAHRFGFILRYPKGKETVTGYQFEPWHLRYVGPPVAEEIFKKGLTLEEYLEF